MWLTAQAAGRVLERHGLETLAEVRPLLDYFDQFDSFDQFDQFDSRLTSLTRFTSLTLV